MTRRKGVRILSICDDDGIRFSRELVLQFEGYEVESVRSNETLDPARLRSFHIAVLCHSISPSRAAEIAKNLRAANPGIGVVRVNAVRSNQQHVYEVDCEVSPGPGQLLSGIRVLTARLHSHGLHTHNPRQPRLA